MAFESILSVAGAVGLIINVIVIAIILVIVSKIVSHEMNFKKSIIMAFIAYFIVPIVIGLIAGVGIPSFVFLIIPLIVWVGLSEVLLSGTMKQKAIVAIISFVVYTVVTMTGLFALLVGMIPF